jgi:hypothetical protein
MKDDERYMTMSTNLVLSSSIFEPSLHNGVKCIRSTRPEDQGTVNQFWFTSKLLCEFFDVADRTLRDNLKALVDDGEIACCDISQCAIPGGKNREYEATIYNLDVLNKLGMCCFRGNKKAREIRNKFNDILVKEETNQNTLPALNKEDKLILLTVKSSSAEDRLIALGTLKDLWTEEANKKTETANKRAFSAMGTASAKSKENTKLKAENEDLKVRLQESTTYLCVKAIPWFSKYFIIPKEKKSESVYSVVGKKLTALSKKLNYEIKNIPTPQYPKGVGAYHIDVIEAFRKQLDNDNSTLAKYRK